MIYLKLFESVGIYKEISFFDFNKKVFNGLTRSADRAPGLDWVDFTDGEVKKLEKILNYGFVNNACNNYLPQVYNYGWRSSKAYITCNKKSSIFKLDDEWYYVTYLDPTYKTWKYYVCDQWDGLIQCLLNLTKS